MADLVKFTDTSAVPENFEYVTNDISGYGVVGQADVPGLSVEQMQRKIEELVRKIVIPLFNLNVDNTCSKDELANTVFTSGAVSSVFGRAGAIVAASGDYSSDKITYDHAVSGLTAESVKAALDELVTLLAAKSALTHGHGSITNDGKLGTEANKVATTGTGGLLRAQSVSEAGLAAAPTAIYGTGTVSVTVADNREYSYTAVTSLAMTGAAVNCHGFVTFAGSTPTISVSNFTKSGGDDITEAAASEVWEFSVCAHNSGSYIVWKNWSV